MLISCSQSATPPKSPSPSPPVPPQKPERIKRLWARMKTENEMEKNQEKTIDDNLNRTFCDKFRLVLMLTFINESFSITALNLD